MLTTPNTSNRSQPESSNSTTISQAKKKICKRVQTAIGVTKFKELVEESTLFIDKTLFIRDFLKDSAYVNNLSK